MNTVLRSEFDAVAAAAFTQAGFELDSQSLQTGHMWYRNSYNATAESSTDGVDLHASDPGSAHDRFPRTPNILTNRLAYYSEAAFRGLLRKEVGVFEVEIPDARALYTRSQKVEVEVVTSPTGFNRAQEILGRTPGVDAFQMTRQPGIGRLKAGPYIESFARMEAPAADLKPEDWHNAQHDLDPLYHASSWLASPASLCTDIAARAEDIIATHGDRIHDAEDDSGRPAEIGKFVYGVDSLFEVTSRFLDLLHNIDEPYRLGSNLYYSQLHHRVPESTSALVNLYKSVMRMNGSFDRRNTKLIHVLEAIGIIPEDTPTFDRQFLAAKVAGEIVVHIAGLLLALEEVVPKESDNPRRRNARVNTLKGVVDSFAGSLAVAA